MGTSQSMELALEGGNMRIIDLLMETECPLPYDPINIAAASGHIKAVRYLVDLGISVTSEAIRSAASHPHILEYLMECAQEA